MMVIDANLWPGGDFGSSDTLGRVAIAQIARSPGGDFADYLAVSLDRDGSAVDAVLLRHRHVMAGWRDLLWAVLDGGQGEQMPLADPRVVKIVDRVALTL